MTDRYRRYASTERDPHAALPGQLTPDGSAINSHTSWSISSRISNDPSRSSSVGLGAYNVSNVAAVGRHSVSGFGTPAGATKIEAPPAGIGLGALPAGTAGIGALPAEMAGVGAVPSGMPPSGALHAGMPGAVCMPVGANMGNYDPLGTSVGRYSTLQDPALVRHDLSVGSTPFNDIDRSIPLRSSESIHGDESNMLFIDGLPTDCTRREVGHLFRPFIGFKEVKLFHKEPRRSGDKARVLCFVEFNDAKCATVALDALQGYKFDDKKPDAPLLRIQFAHFPLRLPS